MDSKDPDNSTGSVRKLDYSYSDLDSNDSRSRSRSRSRDKRSKRYRYRRSSRSTSKYSKRSHKKRYRSRSRSRVSRNRRSRSRRSYTRSRSRSRSPSRSRSRSRRSRSRHHSRRHRRRSPTQSPRRRYYGSREHPSKSKCLGVFGLNAVTNEQNVRNIFDKYGALSKVSVVYDAKTGKSRGFAFVYFKHREDASRARSECNGIQVDDKRIRVDYSITKRAHTPTPGVYMGQRSHPDYYSSSHY